MSEIELPQLCQSPALTSAIVRKAFEAWDPALGMVVIMNAGATLRLIRIVVDQSFDPNRPAVDRAIEFECQGSRYYAAADRVRDNTSNALLTSGE